MAPIDKLSLVEPRQSPKMGRIYDALMAGWPSAIRGYYEADRYVCWGLIGDNAAIMNHYPHIFCDMPYNGRYDPNNEDWDNTYWRWCYNGLHDNRKLDVPDDRFKEWNLPIEEWRDGEEILIIPSSNTMTSYMHGVNIDTWVQNVQEALSKVTNRPIRVRYKPRKNGTSGPSVADVSLEEDLKNCYAVVCSASLVSTEALRLGIPVISTHSLCPSAWCSNDINKMDINKLARPERNELFHNLAYKQYSISEMRSGVCYENSMRYLNGSR